MKLTTANLKNPDYTEKHEIYVGTHIGSFKRLSLAQENPYSQTQLQNIHQLTKDSNITAMAYGNEEKSEILVARANKFVQVFDARTDEFISSVEFPHSPIVGIARYDNRLLAGLSNGKVHILSDQDPPTIIAGDNMSKMRQCSVERKLIATGGKERQNNLKIFDLETLEQVFSSKNLPNDFLQLEVPIWDTDLGFIDANTIATCSRYGYVRLYDTRKQRRPIQKYSNENQMSFSCLIARGNMIYVGTTMGALRAFDTRNFKNFVHTYKGSTGSLSDLCLDDSGKYLFSASLDRYVRVHHTESCVMMYQCYVKSKATALLTKNSNCERQNTEDEDCILLKEETSDEHLGTDEEYEALFDNMQTISGNAKNSKSKKRKGGTDSKKFKKKKV